MRRQWTKVRAECDEPGCPGWLEITRPTLSDCESAFERRGWRLSYPATHDVCPRNHGEQVTIDAGDAA